MLILSNEKKNIFLKKQFILLNKIILKKLLISELFFNQFLKIWNS